MSRTIGSVWGRSSNARESCAAPRAYGDESGAGDSNDHGAIADLDKSTLRVSDVNPRTVSIATAPREWTDDVAEATDGKNKLRNFPFRHPALNPADAPAKTQIQDEAREWYGSYLIGRDAVSSALRRVPPRSEAPDCPRHIQTPSADRTQ